MEQLKWYEKIQSYFAHRYAHRKKFKEEINTIKYGKQGKKRLTFSKALVLFLLGNLLVVEGFSLFFMWRSFDLSSLSTLITCVVGLC